MNLPERPDDFSDEEFAELCDMTASNPKGTVNLDWIRAARHSTTVTVMHPKVIAYQGPIQWRNYPHPCA